MTDHILHPQLQRALSVLQPGIKFSYCNSSSIAEPPSQTSLTISAQHFLSQIETLTIYPEKLIQRGIVPINAADLDGTLWDSDIELFCLNLAAKKKLFKPIIREALSRFMQGIGVTPSTARDSDLGVNIDVIRALKGCEELMARQDLSLEERDRIIEEGYAFEVWAFAGNHVQTIEALAVEAFDKHGFGDKIFRGAQGLIKVFQEKGIETAIFSASHEPLVKACAPYLGIARSNAFGLRLAIDNDGILLNQIQEPMMYREGKAKRLQEFLKGYINDSKPYNPLFSMADNPGISDENLMHSGAIALATNPEGEENISKMIEFAANRKPALILKFDQTVDGMKAK